MDVDGKRGAAGEGRDSPRESVLGQDGRVDSPGEVAQFGGRLLERADRLVEKGGRGLGIVL
jgi:hypothetical protein